MCNNQFQYYSDDELMDQEPNAIQIVAMWKDLPEHVKVQSTLSGNALYESYISSKQILEELNIRLQEELLEIAQCQYVK